MVKLKKVNFAFQATFQFKETYCLIKKKRIKNGVI